VWCTEAIFVVIGAVTDVVVRLVALLLRVGFTALVLGVFL